MVSLYWNFLAVRGGALSLDEAMRLIAQAAAAADHAEQRGLTRLHFALHQFHLHFPLTEHDTNHSDTARQPMQVPMAQWPAWVLKLNPLGSLRNGMESSTWAGEVTLVPGATALETTDTGSVNPALREHYTRGVAQLTCELLGGAPASPVYGSPGRAKYALLPALNEAANTVLQRALGESGAFTSGREFYEALVSAAGHDPVNLLLPAGTIPLPSALAAIPIIRRPPPVVPMTEPMGLILTDAKGKAPVDDLSGPASLAEVLTRNSAIRPPATFDGKGNALPDGANPWDEQDDPPGTVWDRLALVSGEGASSRLWLGGVAAAFVVLLAGCFFFLRALEHHAQRTPSRNTAKAVQTPDPALPRRPHGTVLTKAKITAPHPTPRAEFSEAKQFADAAKPDLSPRSTPSKIAPPAPTPDVSMTPADVANTPPPLIADTGDRLVRVHVGSRPGGVEVTAKGKLLGRTPFDARLPPGDYQLVARYKNWPEVHQSLHIEDGDLNASTELHMMAPALLPTVNIPGDSPGTVRHSQLDSITKRNFVRSTRGNGIQDSPAPPPDVSTTPAPGPDGRRTSPALDPFDPAGVFRSNARQRDDG